MIGDRPLKIVLALPLYGGSLPVGRYCATALTRLGHHVDVFEAPDFHSAHVALRNLKLSAQRQEQLESAYLNMLSQAIYARVEAFEPDLVLALAQAPLNRQTLARLRKDGVATAMWFVEDYSLFTYWRAFAPLYDYFFVIQKEPFLGLLQEAGARACYLPLAADPAFHCPQALSPAQSQHFGSDISFLGAGYPNRRLAFRALAGPNFKIWGSDWEGDDFLAPYVQEGGRRISPEEGVKIFCASRVNLNLHSSVQVEKLVNPGDFVNPRTFEIAACGAFQLVDRRGLMPELFQTQGAEAELAVFDSLPELEEKITWFLAHEEERLALARRGQARVLAEHTYERRMQSLLEHIARNRPGWPAPRRQSPLLPETPGLEPEQRARLEADQAALRTRLELPAQSSFEDVSTRLRQESGVLGSLECSLLFLDEWRKQYGG